MQPVIPAAKHRTWPEPATLVALFAAAQIVTWTLAPALTHSAPPIDVVEGYMWGREWVIATYKHPALPSWFLEASRVLTGGTIGWPAYLVSQLFIAATFGLVFLLGRDMMGPERAAAGTCCWPASRTTHGRRRSSITTSRPRRSGRVWRWRCGARWSGARIVWWMLLGAFAAGALYAKLSAALILDTGRDLDTARCPCPRRASPRQDPGSVSPCSRSW